MGQNLLIGSAKAISLGNAVTADPPGIDSIHFNPAGLTKLKGRQRQLKFIVGDIVVEAQFDSNPEYDALLAQYNLEDPMANSSSEVKNFALYLPGLGVTEVPVVAAPLGGASFSPADSNITFATAAYAPLMLGYTREDDDIGRFYGASMGLSRITFLSPTIGWKVTDALSLGAGIGFSYFGVGLSLDYRAPNAFVGALKGATDDICLGADNGFVFEGVPLDLCGGSVSPFERVFTLEVELEKTISTTFNFGLLWEPTEWFSFGLVYQSEANDTLEGDINVIFDDQLVNLFQGLADSNVLAAGLIDYLGVTKNGGRLESTGSINIILPQHIAAGVSLQLTPSIKINIDYKWTETSVWQEFNFKTDEKLPVLELLQSIEGVEPDAIVIPRGYEDATNWAFGIEYQYSDSTALRFGYEPRDSGIPDDKLDFLIPMGDFDLYGIGFSHTLVDGAIVEFALAYGRSEQYIPAGSSTNGNNYNPDNFVYNPSAGLDVTSVIEFTIVEMSYQSEF
ncbi:hypothetical protein A9Q99_08905 [Gammaproteobacteria bacterium 45_16_T64]|nr:hypothetical protein A9Q99_08905 [Gammaproteobacteria bacterium 45_16_T64]